MTSLGLALARLLKGLWRGMHDADFRAIALVLVVTLLGGTLFYRGAEGWPWMDAVLYAVMTLATIGHPSLEPTTTVSKVFTIIYVLVGVGVMLAFVARLATHIVRDRKD